MSSMEFKQQESAKPPVAKVGEDQSKIAVHSFLSFKTILCVKNPRGEGGSQGNGGARILNTGILKSGYRLIPREKRYIGD